MKCHTITALSLKETQTISGGTLWGGFSKSITRAIDKLGLAYCVSQDARRLIQRRDTDTIAQVGICLVVTGVCSEMIGSILENITLFFSIPESKK